MENEKHPLDYLKNDAITENMWKMRNAHCRTWNIARKLKKVVNLEMSTVGPGIWHEN